MKNIIAGLELGGGLKGAHGLKRFVLGLWAQGEMARSFLGVSTLLANGTSGTGSWGKANIDDGIVVLVMGLRPLLAGMSLRTGDAFGLPVDDKAGKRKGVGGKRLPAMVLCHGADNRNLMVRLTFDEQARVYDRIMNPPEHESPLLVHGRSPVRQPHSGR